MLKWKSIHEGESGVICVSLGHNISRIIISIHVQKNYNDIFLGFPSDMLVKKGITTLEFTSRHDSKIENQ